jgi:hypothetical protein
MMVAFMISQVNSILRPLNHEAQKKTSPHECLEQLCSFGNLASRSGGTVKANENGDETCKLDQQG